MIESRTSRWLIAFLIFAGTIMLFAPPLVDVPFSTRGEAREGLVVTAMIDQKELVLPLRNGTVIPSKPPLFHWIARGMVSMLGIHSAHISLPPSSVLAAQQQRGWSPRGGLEESALLEFAIRLPSVLGAALCLAALFIWLEPICGRRETFAAIAVLGTSFEMMRSASIARVDMVFAAALTAALVAINIMVDRYYETRKVSIVPFAIVVIAVGAAALAKGPAGIAFPWVIGGIYVLCLLPLRAVPFGWAAGAIAGSILLALAWYVPAYLKGGERFLDVHLMRENVARIVGMDDYETGHEAPFYMTPLLFLAAFLPWTLFIPLLGDGSDYHPRAICRRIFRRPVDARERLELFAIIWILFFIVFFSITASKRSAYLLPALPPAAALLGPALLRNARGRWRSCAAVFGAVSAVLGLLLAAIVILPADRIEKLLVATVRKEYAREQAQAALFALRENPIPLTVLALGIALTGVTASRLWKRQTLPAMSSLAAGMAGVFLGIGTAVTPTIARSQSPRPFMQQVLSSIPSTAPLSQYKHDFYAATFYGDPFFGGKVIPLVEKVPSEPPLRRNYWLAAAEDVPELRNELRASGADVEVALASSSLNLYGKDRLVLLELSARRDAPPAPQ